MLAGSVCGPGLPSFASYLPGRGVCSSSGSALPRTAGSLVAGGNRFVSAVSSLSTPQRAHREALALPKKEEERSEPACWQVGTGSNSGVHRGRLPFSCRSASRSWQEQSKTCRHAA